MTPFKQAYVVTYKSGDMFLAVVLAASFDEGKRAADLHCRAVRNLPNEAAWDICAYPVIDLLKVGHTRLAPAYEIQSQATNLAHQLDTLNSCQTTIGRLDLTVAEATDLADQLEGLNAPNNGNAPIRRLTDLMWALQNDTDVAVIACT